MTDDDEKQENPRKPKIIWLVVDQDDNITAYGEDYFEVLRLANAQLLWHAGHTIRPREGCRRLVRMVEWTPSS